MEPQLNKALLVSIAKYSDISSFAKKIYSDGYANKLSTLYSQIIHSNINSNTISTQKHSKAIQVLKENLIIISNEISNDITKLP
jgi:hypothetical protein